MMISITGTPGTGKTTIASCLKDKGENVIDLNQYIEKNGLKERFDKRRDTYSVDVEKLNASIKAHTHKDRNLFIEGHLSHFLDCDMVIVIRCNPSVLYDRLKKRNYTVRKVTENVQAEALDVVLCESAENNARVFEIDNTSCTAEQAVSAIRNIVKGRTEGHEPGSIDWSEEMVKWC